MIRVRKPYQVLRRSGGEYVRGVWVPALEPEPATVLLGIQPATLTDYERLQANPEGRRVVAMLRAYGEPSDLLTAAGIDSDAPGDLVQIDGAYWLVIGRHVRTSLDSPVSHVRYLLAKEVESTVPEYPA